MVTFYPPIRQGTGQLFQKKLKFSIQPSTNVNSAEDSFTRDLKTAIANSEKTAKDEEDLRELEKIGAENGGRLTDIQAERYAQLLLAKMDANNPFHKLPPKVTRTNIPPKNKTKVLSKRDFSSSTTSQARRYKDDLRTAIANSKQTARKEADLKKAIQISKQTGPRVYRPVSFHKLWGENLKDAYMRQKTTHCFLYAGLDTILHDPEAKKILRKMVKVSETSDRYKVKFPGQPEPLVVKKNRLKYAVDSNKLGLKLIDLAYREIPGVKTGEFEDTGIAFGRIFGDTHPILIDSSPVNLLNGQFISTGSLKRELTHWINNKSASAFINIPTIFNPREAHYYSLRLPESTPERLVLGDPWDTKRKPKVISVDNVINKGYAIRGIQIPTQ